MKDKTIEFLSRLQKDLLEDRANEFCQADPIYYGIIDRETYPSPDGCGDGVTFWDNEACEEVSAEAIVTEAMENGEEWTWVDDNAPYNGFELDENGEVVITDLSELVEAIKDNCCDIQVTDFQEVSEIQTDCFFLTRKDADSFLKSNRHHYTEKAHSYAMTARRYPRYEELLQIIKGVDWEKSTLIMKEE